MNAGINSLSFLRPPPSLFLSMEKLHVWLVRSFFPWQPLAFLCYDPTVLLFVVGHIRQVFRAYLYKVAINS